MTDHTLIEERMHQAESRVNELEQQLERFRCFMKQMSEQITRDGKCPVCSTELDLSRAQSAEITQLREQLAQEWLVEVLSDSDANKKLRTWAVLATTEDEAMQIAFALDGGWSPDDLDATEMLTLAKCYCRAERVSRKFDKAGWLSPDEAKALRDQVEYYRQLSESRCESGDGGDT